MGNHKTMNSLFHTTVKDGQNRVHCFHDPATQFYVNFTCESECIFTGCEGWALNVDLTLLVLLEVHGDVQDRIQPGATVTGFLSTWKKAFKSETDVGQQK